MKFSICLAEKNIEIQSTYSKIYEMCREYLTQSDRIDMHITVSADDIQYERKRSEKQDIKEGKPIRNYSTDYLETLAVYRKISSEMLRFDTLLIHGSAVAVGDKAVIFTGPSGRGKTTHSRLWTENISGSYILNGDKPLVRVEDHEAVVFGTPWAGKENLGVNRKTELCAIVFLENSDSNQITEIDPMSEFENLMKQIYLPETAPCMQKILELTGKLCENVTFFRLQCNMEPDAALVSWNALKKLLIDQADISEIV